MNHFNISGIIATDPQLQIASNNTKYCRFRVAHEIEKQGTKRKEYYTVVAWKKEAENICDNMKKGSPILVSGYLRTNNFETESGVKATSTSVFVEKAYGINLHGNNNLNYTNLMGRLTAKPVYEVNENGKSCCKFTIAVDRREVNSEGKRQADFIKCIAWNKKAEAIAKYFDKGYRIALGGHLRMDDYINEKTQEKFEYVQCVVDDFNYIEKKMDKEYTIEQSVQPATEIEEPRMVTDPESGLPFPEEPELTPEEVAAMKQFKEERINDKPVTKEVSPELDDDNEIAGPDEDI